MGLYLLYVYRSVVQSVGVVRGVVGDQQQLRLQDALPGDRHQQSSECECEQVGVDFVADCAVHEGGGGAGGALGGGLPVLPRQDPGADEEAVGGGGTVQVGQQLPRPQPQDPHGHLQGRGRPAQGGVRPQEVPPAGDLRPQARQGNDQKRRTQNQHDRIQNQNRHLQPGRNTQLPYQNEEAEVRVQHQRRPRRPPQDLQEEGPCPREPLGAGGGGEGEGEGEVGGEGEEVAGQAGEAAHAFQQFFEGDKDLITL